MEGQKVKCVAGPLQGGGWGGLTLSQPGGADDANPILVSTPSFESHRRA